MLWRVTAAFLLSSLLCSAQPQLTPAPRGPFHVEGRVLVDTYGNPFQIRGTQLPGLDFPTTGFGPHSATTLITIRQRWNMNTVRIPVSIEHYQADASYLSRLGEVVRRANDLELLVILAASGMDTAHFWSRAAGYFQNYPNVLFAAAPDAVHKIRAAGARQPIVVATREPVADPNVIYEYAPSWNRMRIDPANRGPALASIPDLHLKRQCRFFPANPSAAEDAIDRALTEFDEHGVSWIASAFEPGRLIVDYRSLNATTLDNGFACDTPADRREGMGVAVQYHLLGAEPRGLLVVNAATGGIVVPRGGIAIGYGPIFGLRKEVVPDQQFRSELAGVSASITDAEGASHVAAISYVSDGWGQINLLIPDDCASGPAQVTLVSADQRHITANVIVSDVSPGVFTGSADSRGAAMGFIEADDTPIFRCRDLYEACTALEIPLPATVRFRAMGLLHAGPLQDLRVTVAGTPVRVASIRPGPDPGIDELVLELPSEFSGRGEADMVFRLKGVLSNVVRLNLGPRQVIDSADTARAELGRRLFYDQRMSVNGAASCASCHRQELAFTDGNANAVGATGEVHPRSAMSLVNVSDAGALTWSNPTLEDLETQATTPMFSTSPIELGLTDDGNPFLNILRGDTLYQTLFRKAFPGELDMFTMAHVSRALAAFERTIVSRRSPYDRFVSGELDAISDGAKRGEALFFSPPFGCGSCHSGADFEDGSFHNTGLYDPYLAPNEGIVAHTGQPADIGKFKTPSLRNVALTAPYMHDGSIATLDAVLDHYAAGGREMPAGKDTKMTGFPITPQNRKDLVAFLESLTDQEVVHDPRFSDPWPPAARQ